jgi:CSLREA domain-containing protein
VVIPRSLGLLAALSLLSMCLVIASPSAGAGQPTVTVDTTVDSYDGACDDGDCSLRDAVRSAASGGTVLVPPGFYPLTITGNGGVGEGSIELRRRVRIVGDGETGAFIDATTLGAPTFTTSPRTDRPTPFDLEHLTLFGAQDASVTGGAIRAEGGHVRLRDVTVTGGAVERGGGIAVDTGGRLTMIDSLVLANEASSGGGIWNKGVAAILRSSIAGNAASEGGGIASTPGSTTQLETSTIARNTAAGEGGGLRLRGPAEIAGTTVADNEAVRGGGIASSSGAVRLARSIVAGNRAERARQCDGPLQSAGANVDQSHRCGFDQPRDLEDVDPMLGRLRSNGGPTPTMALRPASPAIGIGGDCGGRDQRGAPRDGRCDGGAYELVRCLGKPVDIVGTPDDEELSGGRGPDVFLGLGGGDEFQGSIGKDRACGGPGDDLLIAGPGNDRFWGDAGNDRVKGESGDDLLSGGPGRDRLAGGPGDDICDADRRDAHARCEVFVAGAARAPVT